MVTKDSQFTLVGLGELLWDLLPTGRQLGGAPANFAFHAQALGEEGKVVSCVGTDDLGHEAIDLLQQLELDSSYVAVDEELPVAAHLLQVSAEESEFLAEVANRYSLHLIAVTKGASGSRLFTSDYDGEQQPEPMEVVDTVGAGDSFAAAMTVGLLRGCDLDRIHRTANRLASYVCTQAGAMPVLPIELSFL